jgi:hypothetical protein
MQRLVLAPLSALLLLAWVVPALAHGGAPHPKCKPGYALDAEHKCVKAPKK